MLTYAAFENFKSLRDVQIDFEPLTVIVGPNASGKTSILQGLQLLSSFAQATNGPPPPKFELLQNRMADEFKIVLMACDSSDALRIVLTPVPKVSTSPRDVLNKVDSSNGSAMTWQLESKYALNSNDEVIGGEYRWDLDSPLPDKRTISPLFGSVKLCRLDPRKLAQTSYGRDANGVLGDGHGLASRLALIALRDPERFETIQQHLRSLIPSIKRIRFDRVSITKQEIETITVENVKIPRQIERNYQEDLILFDMSGGNGIPANLASEGTLLALGLITELIDSPHPRILLIDDIEQGLHPTAQRNLVPMLRQILERDSELQVIATTHSPYIVDEFAAQEVRITWANEFGSTQCGRLTDHSDFERWREELWPGEFWSIVGEKWISEPKVQEVP